MGFELYIRTPIKMNPTLKEALRSGEIRTVGPRTKEYKELSPDINGIYIYLHGPISTNFMSIN